MSKKTSFWESVEDKREWVNFEDNVSIDFIVKDGEPKEIETPWGVAFVIDGWQYRQGDYEHGFRKLLRIDSKRLQRGLKNASPNGIVASGNGYRITRILQGFDTKYNVTYLGKFEVLLSGKVKLQEELE